MGTSSRRDTTLERLFDYSPLAVSPIIQIRPYDSYASGIKNFSFSIFFSFRSSPHRDPVVLVARPPI